MRARHPLDLFMLNAAHKHGGDDLSGDAIGGDDFECACDKIEGLHYEWDHRPPATPSPPEEQPSASDKRNG